MTVMTFVSSSSFFCRGVLSGLGRVEHRADVADLGVHAGAGDDHLAAAARDRGVHVGHAGAVAQRDLRFVDRRDVFGDRHTLARQRAFLDLDGRRDEQPAVGRHEVARLHQHDVAGHDLAGVDLHRLAVAANAGDGLHHPLERSQARLGLCLLVQPHDGVEHGQTDQHERRAEVVGDQLVDDAGAQQDHLHQVLVLAQERLSSPVPS